MKILLLAPHPFYQERGTPIAVRLLLRVLSERGETVDVLTYPEGEDVAIPNVTIHRIPRPPFVRNIPPGPSWKKIACDAVMFFKAWRMARPERYDIVHAVEESVFMAMFLRRFRGIPYVFDMDSSMPQQIVDKFPRLAFLASALRRLESRAIRGAAAVVPMCDALADLAKAHSAERVVVLRDISLLGDAAPAGAAATPAPAARPPGFRFMYIGNLESYQGIDLLLESFALVAKRRPDARLAIAGGARPDIEAYQRKAEALGIGASVEFLGHQPLAAMGALFESADALVSPRVQGKNTPMKIYSYLDSGRPIVATDLPTHTQVLSPATAMLAAPNPDAFAAAMLRLAEDAALRASLASAAKALAQREYSFAVYRRTLNTLYDDLASALIRRTC